MKSFFCTAMKRGNKGSLLSIKVDPHQDAAVSSNLNNTDVDTVLSRDDGIARLFHLSPSRSILSLVSFVNMQRNVLQSSHICSCRSRSICIYVFTHGHWERGSYLSPIAGSLSCKRGLPHKTDCFDDQSKKICAIVVLERQEQAKPSTLL